MKNLKIILILVLISFVGLSSSFAQETTYKTASPFVRVTTNMLGYNFIAKKIAQGVLKSTINRSAKGKYKVKFDSFSGVDLKKGKFKGLTIDGEKLNVDDELFISNLHIKTTSDFNYVDYKKNPMVFKTDLPMEFSIVISEEDLNKTVSSGKTIDALSSIIPLMSIDKPKIKIENEKIKLSSSLNFPFSKTVKFSMSSKLKVENGKIVLDDVVSSSQNEFAKKLVNMINKQSMLENIDLNLFDGADTKASVSDVIIKNKKIYINGNILVKKS